MGTSTRVRFRHCLDGDETGPHHRSRPWFVDGDPWVPSRQHPVLIGTIMSNEVEQTLAGVFPV